LLRTSYVILTKYAYTPLLLGSIRMFYAYINKLCTSGFQNPEFKNDLMKNILLIIIASLNLVFSYSQEKKIKGVIIDNSNTPIMYANIGVLNKPLGTVSNEKGKFSLNIYKNYIQDTLKVSCLGYKSKELLIKTSKLNSNGFA